jgi:hypothetical protein
MPFLRRYRRLCIAFAISVFALYCGGGENVGPPPPGTLEITTSTNGVEQDADGYSVQIDGGSSQPIGVAATITSSQLTPGTHTVQLGETAANGTVAGDDPRTVTVTAGETTTVSFAVSCKATTGSLSITSATTGPSPDADGYTVLIDGAERDALAPNAAVTIDGLTAGDHQLGLNGVAANCQIQGDNARTVTIPGGENTGEAYTISCVAPPPDVGSLRVVTTTSGPDADVNGYSFKVDAGTSQPVAVNAETILSNLAAGGHRVELADLAGNCRLQGTNPRSVTVTAGATTDLRFAITCTPTTGTIRVGVTTSGSPSDPDGYRVTRNEEAPGVPIETNGSVSLTGIAPATHTIALTELAPNCSVTGGSASRAVTVDAGATSEVTFTVTCTPAGIASKLEKVSGDLQTGPAGTALGAPLMVKVTDAVGSPVQGVTITWSVTGGGSLSLTSTPTDPSGQASVTRMLGSTVGQQTTLATSGKLAGSPAIFTHNVTGSNANAEGRWDPAFPTPVVAVHVHVLATGNVLLWGDRGDAQLWDPANPAAGFIPVAKTFRMYCSAHTLLQDGRLLVVGGTSPNTRGLRFATIFDPATRTWTSTTSMAQGRYYPTITALPDGEVLVVSGHDSSLAVVTTPEVWNGSSWHQLTTAPLAIPDPYYPDMFVAPNGKVFLAGYPQTTRYLDVSGTGQWTTVAERNVADRTMGSAVMYAPGKILYAGGGDPPTRSAEVIDLNNPSPSWRNVSGMAFPRRQLNATILADGTVLVTGGTSAPGFNNQAGAIHAAELWNPETERWTILASESKHRTYHGTTVLLPTAQVLSSGSGEGGGIPFANSEFSAQVFTPPYLLNADGTAAVRPSVTSAPARISYGQSFTVETPDAASVSKGTLIRLSSVTHAFNQSQVIYPLTFAPAGPTSLGAVAPTNPNLAPPGPYMLFLVNAAGVPSVAKMVSVGP